MKGRQCFCPPLSLSYGYRETQRDILYRQRPNIIILFPKAQPGRNTQSFSPYKSKYSMQNMMQTTLNTPLKATRMIVKLIMMRHRWRHLYIHTYRRWALHDKSSRDRATYTTHSCVWGRERERDRVCMSKLPSLALIHDKPPTVLFPDVSSQAVTAEREREMLLSHSCCSGWSLSLSLSSAGLELSMLRTLDTITPGTSVS